MKQDLRSLRAQLQRLQAQLPDLLQDCFGREALLPGSLYLSRRKCGKPACHCNQGVLHESLVLSYRGQGQPRNLSPTSEQLEPIRNMTEHYRRCRQTRAQLVRWDKELLKLVDQIEAVRIQLGEAEFRKLGLSRPRLPRSTRN